MDKSDFIYCDHKENFILKNKQNFGNLLSVKDVGVVLIVQKKVLKENHWMVVVLKNLFPSFCESFCDLHTKREATRL